MRTIREKVTKLLLTLQGDGDNKNCLIISGMSFWAAIPNMKAQTKDRAMKKNLKTVKIIDYN